jgi:Protein of unknown function (DUF1273).
MKLILVLPCYTQTRNGREKDIEIYKDIKQRSDKFVYISKKYTYKCMFKRNRHLVDNSSVCICYLTKQNGGTAYTMGYAKLNRLHIINVAN